MSRDYNTPERRPPRKGGSPMFSGVVIGLLLGLCLALGVALYVTRGPSPFVSRDKAAETAKPAEGQTAKGKPAMNVEGLPKAEPQRVPGQTPTQQAAADGKKRFEFYDILPGKQEPSTGKTPKPAADKEVYYLQAGAFQNASDADNLKARLALAGLEAQIQTAVLPDSKTWHRVRLGPYASAEAAGKAQGSLKDNKIEASLIKVKEPQDKR